MRRLDDHGLPGETPHRLVDVEQLGGGDPVGLVHDHEVGDRQVPVGIGVPLPRGGELRRVDDLDEPAVHDPLVLAGEDHPDQFLRLGEAARLDHDHVQARLGAGEDLQVLVEFARVDGAAQTAVAEGDGGADLAA